MWQIRCTSLGRVKKRLTENSMFFLSWFTARGSGTASVCFITLTDSPEAQRWVRVISEDIRSIFFCCLFLMTGIPVRMDWSTRRVVDLMEMILMSAGTLSPTIVRTIDKDRKANTWFTLKRVDWLDNVGLLLICPICCGDLQCKARQQSDSSMQVEGGRGDWLVLALWMNSVVVENRYHCESQRESKTLGRS